MPAPFQIEPQAGVACILVNFNNWQDTAACLAALALQTHTTLTILVVDNASTNDSLAQLRTAHPGATYLETPLNAGFSAGCNLGARHPLALAADFLWLLNNDTIPPPDTLSKLLATATSNPRAGIIGSVLHYAHVPAQIQAWGGGAINLWTAYGRHYTSATPLTPTSYLTFASALIRRSVFDQLDGLHEGFFLYFEDVDFNFRAVAIGWQLVVATDTAILHKEGGSTPQPKSPLLERVTTASGLLFLRRHAPVPSIACTLYLLSRLAKRLLTGRWRSIFPILRGFSDFRRNPAHPYPIP